MIVELSSFEVKVNYVLWILEVKLLMTQNMYILDLDMYVCFVIYYMPQFMIVALTLKDSRVKHFLKCVMEQYIQRFLKKCHKGEIVRHH